MTDGFPFTFHISSLKKSSMLKYSLPGRSQRCGRADDSAISAQGHTESDTTGNLAAAAVYFILSILRFIIGH